MNVRLSQVMSVASLLDKAVAEVTALAQSEETSQSETLSRKALNSLSQGTSVR